jgi:sulfite dehydrogenase
VLDEDRLCIPDNGCACTEPSQAAAATAPVKLLDVRSFITNLADGANVKARIETLVKGIAFDGGYGITEVSLSTNGGQSWSAAQLGPDLGRYSFREWQTMVRLSPGKHELKVRAINRIGQSQPRVPLWNPAGYMRNVVETVRVQAV